MSPAAERFQHSSSFQFPNTDALDFSDIADMKPVQEFSVPQGREVGEYSVMYVLAHLCIT